MPRLDVDLSGRLVVVTGAGRGLGRAIATACAKSGASVAALDSDNQLLEETVSELRDQGLEVNAYHCDIGEPSQVQTTFDQLETHPWGVINNAGLADGVGGLPFWEIDVEDWQRILKVNLTGTWLVSKYATALMIRAREGRLINLASDAALYGSPRLAHYIASKGALIALTRGMARDLGHYEITVNAIAPGLTLGASTENIPEERHQLYADNRALKRPQLPEDVIGITTFLLSEQSSYITGQTIVVDGGFVMH